MRPSFPHTILLLALALGTSASAQTCTGLSCQQVSCTSGGTTSISGVVYAPNGMDPLPNVTVYVPNAPVDAFTAGVSCPAVGTAPSGSPLVGTTTATDGSFTIADMPVGPAIPLVIVSGRWRRQITVDTSQGSCANTAISASVTRFPRNQTEGDIPKFAISSGNVDQVECVLRKVGIDDAEFTNPAGTGRINIYTGTNGPGAKIVDGNPSLTESSLMGNSSTLNQYDVLMLPCEGGQFNKPATELANLVTFANVGGRVYASHYEYDYLYKNPPFDTVANWLGTSTNSTTKGTATVDTSFVVGKTLSSWLELVGASPTPPPQTAQIEVDTIRQDISGVNAPTQSWLALNTALGNVAHPVMQFVFDTPVGQTAGQCGRVLFNEYHVETTVGSSTGYTFPLECGATTTTLTPQEKLLEFSLFELTDDGGTATLSPASADFGSVAVGFASGAQTFTWTNHSTFTSGVTLLNASGDFQASSSNCTTVKGGDSCTISVVFSPTVLGARTGVLSVGSGAQTLTATLTGTGLPGLTLTPASLTFGSVDVGGTQVLQATVSNLAPGALPLPAIVLAGDFSATTNCPGSVGAGTSCTIFITFAPTATGARAGSLALNAGYATLSTTLTGNGQDFTAALAPASGTSIAGQGIATAINLAPVAGFTGNIKVFCSTNAPGTTCTVVSPNLGLGTGASSAIQITTTAQYTVIGYGGLGSGGGLMLLLALGSGGLLWVSRKRTGTLVRSGMVLVLLAAGTLMSSGCSGKLPSQNAVYTAAGPHSFTVTATDGIITHSVTYMLNVTVK